MSALPDSLFRQIVDCLWQHDQAALMRVSRRFRRIVEPIMYKDITLSRRRRTGKFKRCCKKNPAMAKRVTSLTVDATTHMLWHFNHDPPFAPPHLWKPSKICHALEYMDNLESLHLTTAYFPEYGDFYDEDPDSDDQWRRHEQKLERTFERATHIFHPAPDAERRILPRLTTLTLSAQLLGPDRHRAPLPGLTVFFIPTLRTLSIANHDISHCTTWGNGGYLHLDRRHRRSTALRALRLANCRLHEPSLRRILECPRALADFALTVDPPAPDAASSSDTYPDGVNLFAWSAEGLAAALREQRDALERLELYVGGKRRGLPGDELGGPVRGTLDLREMERLAEVRCLHAGRRLSKRRLLLREGVEVEYRDLLEVPTCDG
ncbi:uncharacterized protein BKCO1_4100028 [Diplodia corticola]|uniref:F-box domain-containing protein n=1 Tax=Diplodia corticola TaxID=236234 RepID=A0A1J9QT51_9PEZI|nr:uncharacterized protein BKCO1_4100028 [Diplodia corticola]OJD32142.1 hypothetical protein BKCO1_4100028 [Diplodia corticola]